MNPAEKPQQHRPSGMAALEVLQLKFNLRLQTLVILGISAFTFIFSVATLGLAGRLSYYYTYVPGEFVWLTLLSIFSIGAFGFFFWKSGDGARSPNFAPTVWHLSIAIILAVCWFSASIAPVAGSGIVPYCTAYTRYAGGSVPICGVAGFTTFLAWMNWVFHVIAVLTIVAQGQKHASFSNPTLIPLSNVQQYNQPPQVVVADNQGYQPQGYQPQGYQPQAVNQGYQPQVVNQSYQPQIVNQGYPSPGANTHELPTK